MIENDTGDALAGINHGLHSLHRLGQLARQSIFEANVLGEVRIHRVQLLERRTVAGASPGGRPVAVSQRTKPIEHRSDLPMLGAGSAKLMIGGQATVPERREQVVLFRVEMRLQQPAQLEGE